jgi:hypothetical protein
VVLDRVFLQAAVGLALLARVAPAEGRLDAVAGVVGKGQADGAGGRDGQQVRIAQALGADLLAQRLRQARRKGVAAEQQVGVEELEGATLLGQVGAGFIGRVAQHLGDAGRLLARRGLVVAQAQHHQRVAQAGEAQADAALAARFFLLLRQRPDGGVQHVVQHAHGHLRHLDEGRFVETRRGLEGVAHKARQVDAAQAAAAVGGQGLLGAVVYDQAVGVEGVHVGHGHVVDVLFAAGRERGHRRGEALAVQAAPVRLQCGCQALRLGRVGKAHCVGPLQQVVAADDQFVQGTARVLALAAMTVGHGTRACSASIGVDRRGNAHAQQHALHRLQQAQVGLGQAHADTLCPAHLAPIRRHQTGHAAHPHRRRTILARPPA